MGTERVDSIYDLASLEAEQERFESLLLKSKNGILALNEMRITAKASDIAGFAQAQEKLNKSIADSVAATNKATTAKQQLTKAEIEARLASQQRTAAIKNEIIETNAAKGSYDQLVAQLKRLQNQYKALSDTERSSDVGKGLLTNINATKTSLKEIDSTLGDHQRKVGSYADAIASSFEHILGRVLEYVGAYAVIEGLTKFIKGTAEAAIEAEKATFRFKGTLDNLGRLDAFERLKRSSEQLHEEFQFFEKPQIIGVFEQLVTFGKLSENQINELTPVIINFAAKSGLSLKEATTSILAAIEGQAKGLKQYGINIKDAKTEVERFGIIMDELAPKVNGAAAAFGETTQGNIEKTKIRFKELQEEIGNKVLPTINALLNGFNNVLKDVASDGIGKVIGNTIKGIDIYLFEGYQSLKKYQQLQKDIHAGIVGEDGKPIAVLIQPKDTVVPDQNKPFDGGKGLSDVDKAKAAADAKALEESLKRAAAFHKQALDEIRKANADELLAIKDKYKAVADDQLNSFSIRLGAEQAYALAGKQLIETNKADAINSLNYEIENDKKNAKSKEEIRQIDFLAKTKLNEINKKAISDESIFEISVSKDTAKIVAENYKYIADAGKTAYAEITAAIARTAKDNSDKIAIEKDNKLIQLDKDFQNGKIKNIDDFNKEKQKIENDASLQDLLNDEKRITADEAMFGKSLDLQKQFADDEVKINDLKNKKIADQEREASALKKQLVQESFNFVQTLVDAGFENTKNRLQDEITANDAKTKRAIDAENASTDSAQVKADKIAAIEARAAVQTNQIKQQQKNADIAKAKFDKAVAIAKIIEETAVAIIKSLPEGLVTGITYLIGALGALQLATVIATPIPKYKGGRGYGKDELALVHPGEYIHREGGIEATPGVESLTHLMPKDKVYPSKAAMMKELAMSAMPLSNYHVNKNGGIDKADMKHFTSEIVGAVDNIKLQATVLKNGDLRKYYMKLSEFDRWVNKYIKN